VKKRHEKSKMEKNFGRSCGGGTERAGKNQGRKATPFPKNLARIDNRLRNNWDTEETITKNKKPEIITLSSNDFSNVFRTGDWDALGHILTLFGQESHLVGVVQ
jgi:hypothetical protein